MTETDKFKYPLFNEKGKVLCQVCGKAFMILTPSHLKTHNGMKYSEYSNKFPGAPTTTEEFKALSMYSRPSKYSDEDLNILGDEKVVDEDIPVISDDFDIPPKDQIQKKFDSPMAAKKDEIFSFLVNHLPNVEMDYQIDIFGPQTVLFGKQLLYSTISDFSDPVLKINFEFPNTFWHNMIIGASDPHRTTKLKEFGWKVVTINSKSPSINDLAKEIEKLGLYES